MNTQRQVIYYLIIDCSYSMEWNWETICSMLLKHVERVSQIKRNWIEPKLMIGLFSFNETLLQHAPTFEANRVIESLEILEPKGASALFDAIGTTLNVIAKQVKLPNPPKIFLSILSDGLDNYSKQFSSTKIKELFDALFNRENTDLRVFWLGKKPSNWTGIYYLELDFEAEKMSADLELSFYYLEQVLKI
jgi:hypothetical protein